MASVSKPFNEVLEGALLRNTQIINEVITVRGSDNYKLTM